MRIKRFLPLLLTFIVAAATYLASLCGVYESCIFWSQLYGSVFTIIDPIYIFALFSIPAVLLLPVVKECVFKTWLRFATVWIILSIVVIASTATFSYSWFPIYDFVREDAAKLMGILFSGFSLFLLAWQSYMPKKVREAKL